MKLLNDNEKYISVLETAEILGVCATTIRRYDKSNKLKPHHRTLGGLINNLVIYFIRLLTVNRRYLLSDILNLINKSDKIERKTILYSRVSSHDQKDDMRRQSVRLMEAATADKTDNIELIEDLGSGLNFKKRGLKKLIKLIISSQISTIYLTHKAPQGHFLASLQHRLLRFGSDLVINLAKEFGTKVKILDEEELTFEQELSHDVLEIITVFSARLYGSRSHKNRKNKLPVLV